MTTTPGVLPGVCAIFTNSARSQFVVQQKSEDYVPHPLGISFFGGHMEDTDDTPQQCLTRELTEELGADVARRLPPLTQVFAGEIKTTRVTFHLTLFEAVVPQEFLDHLMTIPVYEGKGAVLLSRDELRAADMIWNLNIPVHEYLSKLE